MPDWNQFEAFLKTFGLPTAMLVAICYALYRVGRLVVRKLLGDDTHEGLVDRWYADERKRWDVMTTQVANQQLLCQSHGAAVTKVQATMDGNHASWQRVASTMCVACREVVEREKPACADIVLRHCDEIERIIGEA